MAKAQFDKAVNIVKELPKDGPVQPTQDDQLYFYSRFKQATIGDVNITRPTGLLDFAGKHKWDAWKALEGTSKEQAMKEYVEKLIELLRKAGDAGSLALVEEIEKAE